MEFSENEVCRTAEHIWRSALGLELAASGDAYNFEASERIVSQVSFEGGFDGQVALECNRRFAGRMASIMFATEEDNLNDEDIDDALREMTNITAGGLKAMTPRSTKMSLPAICSETQLEKFRPKRSQVLGFECAGERLNIVVDGRSEESAGETISVLLVEDSRVARRMISSALEAVRNITFDLDWCESLSDGLSVIANKKFDIVLLDLTLLDSSGLETCVQVHKCMPDLPIVVLTSSDDESFAMDALKAGAQDYLLKAEIAPTLLARSIQYAIERSRAESDRQQLQQQLLDASRQAGIAEMATGILHNVGNVLNSVNLSAMLISDMASNLSVDRLEQTSVIINDHADDLAEFITNDPRGKLLPAVIDRMATQIRAEQNAIESEVSDLVQNIMHIKEIVSAQQAMAKPVGLQVRVDLKELMEQALTTRMDSLAGSGIEVVKDFSHCPVIWADQHRILQILGNLIKNAEEAICEAGLPNPKLTLRVGLCDGHMAFAEVRDTGVGIDPDDVTKLFQHGFTTKSDGHGFGLHSCANAASELNGSLTAHSEGKGLGAAFRLRLPVDTNRNQAAPSNHAQHGLSEHHISGAEHHDHS